jgi:hypothetical protein
MRDFSDSFAPASTALTFESLAPDAADDAAFAYWMGLCTQESYGAATMAAAMVQQYEIEDQAGQTERLFSDGEWRGHFVPIAPVQLTTGWSPFPLALERLGRPTEGLIESIDEGPRAVVCRWVVSRAPDSRLSLRDKHIDATRFRGLLDLATARALRTQQSVLLIGRIGWHAQHSDLTTPHRALMAKAGFAVMNRRAQSLSPSTR